MIKRLKLFRSSPLLFLALACLVLLAACSTTRHHSDESRLVIDAGELIGFELNESTHAWLGIPYAAPPVGELRWRAPQPVASWAEARSALDYGSPCPQLENPTVPQKAVKGMTVVGAEDCLYLNVYAPKSQSAEALPVMFWIHGGGNHYGSAEIYEGVSRLTENGVVVVSINYRLGLLGWFRHAALREGLSDPSDLSGNFGTLDIIAALQWVQRNIAAFGGDPNNVTVFGESAGGRNTWSMVFSPLAKGLFHKAIAQSASLRLADPNKSESYSIDALDYPAYENHSAEVVAKLFPDQQFDDAQAISAALRDVSPEDLYTAVAPGARWRFPSPKVFIDGYVIERDTSELLADPTRYNSVPMIVGANRHESKFYFASDKNLVGKRFGLLPRIREEAIFMRNVGYGSDIWRALSVDMPALRISESGGEKVFAYRFDYDDLIAWPVNMKALYGAAHATEMIPLFRFYQQSPIKWIVSDRKAVSTLGEAMASYWAEFAYNGEPGRGRQGELPLWSSWQREAPLLLLDVESDGGIRMGEDSMTPAMIAKRLRDDDSLSDSEKCQAYLDLFLNNYQTPLAFDRSEYRSLANCEE